MKINTEVCPFKVDKRLVEILETEIGKANVPAGVPVVLNFRDPDYDAESGGFHPVEIRVSAAGSLVYVTDFAYVGVGYCAELCKELDFDFGLRLFQVFGQESKIEAGAEMFALWQENFISYYQMQVYSVTAEAQE
mgnify:CR=1 FL=1